MYLAHSTNTSNCCRMESHASPMVADFCSVTSAIPNVVVIFRETEKSGPPAQAIQTISERTRRDLKGGGGHLLGQGFCLSEDSDGRQVL